jgi:hypothetical protein
MTDARTLSWRASRVAFDVFFPPDAMIERGPLYCATALYKVSRGPDYLKTNAMNDYPRTGVEVRAHQVTKSVLDYAGLASGPFE